MEFVRLRAHQYQKFDGSVVQNAKNGRTLSGADAPALPKGELLCIFRAAQIKLPLPGELLSEAKLRGSHKKSRPALGDPGGSRYAVFRTLPEVCGLVVQALIALG